MVTWRMGSRRNAELAKIHIAKAQLGLDETTYRTMLQNVGGASSSAKLDWQGRAKVLTHLAALGFQDNHQGEPKRRRTPAYKGRPRNMDKRGSRARQMEKIEALLTIGQKSWAYGDALAQRICKVDKVAWVPEGDLYKIISALRYQAKREGWDLSGELAK